MNWYDVAFCTAIYLMALTTQALYQAKRFANQKTISHLLHAIYYGLFCAAIGALYWANVGLGAGIKIAIYGCFVRLAFFEFILNGIRGKPIWYNAPTDSRPGDLLDWWENKILRANKPGGQSRIITLKIMYLILWLAYLIFILCN